MGEAEWLHDHAQYVGRIWGNLLGVEMAARKFIAENVPHEKALVKSQLPQLKEDDWVELNVYTRQPGLANTLDLYNKYAPADCQVDAKALFKLRNTLGHGRMFGFGDQPMPLRLLKFGEKEKTDPDGTRRVRVEVRADMTEEWFLENLNLTDDAFDKIGRGLGPGYVRREFKPLRSPMLRNTGPH